MTEHRIIQAKPFLKWAGGKTQLLPTLDCFLPKVFPTQQNATYIEPFVGGGAMLFYMLRTYSNIKRAVVNDINPHLITTYKVIRDLPGELIELLEDTQHDFYKIESIDGQRDFFLGIRNKFNQSALTPVEEAAHMIFLNRTCFNGLYRENSKGQFNVPFGRYARPTICDTRLLIMDGELLKRVAILQGDFAQTARYAGGYTLIYLDPPYRPLDATSNFNTYVKEAFDDKEQTRLKEFFCVMHEDGNHVMLSNSDGKTHNGDDFLDNLYQGFHIERVSAKRSINSNPQKRNAITELLIYNYNDIKAKPNQ